MFASLLSDIRIFLILTLMSVFLGLADNLHFLDLPKSQLQKVTIPIQYGLYKSSRVVSRQIDLIILARKAVQDNKALQVQLALILSENATLRKQLTEYGSFLDQQKTLNPQIFNLVPARPIGISRYLLIDKGFDDGLKVGQVVIYKDNYLGQIKEVNSKKSKVLLAFDPDSKIAAFSVNQSGRAKGVLIGQFGSQALLDKILHQEPINVDDLVYTEGSGLEIPRGLILGQVTEVLSRDNQIFKQSKIKPIFDITNLDIVFVITN